MTSGPERAHFSFCPSDFPGRFEHDERRRTRLPLPARAALLVRSGHEEDLHGPARQHDGDAAAGGEARREEGEGRQAGQAGQAGREGGEHVRHLGPDRLAARRHRRRLDRRQAVRGRRARQQDRRVRAGRPLARDRREQQHVRADGPGARPHSGPHVRDGGEPPVPRQHGRLQDEGPRHGGHLQGVRSRGRRGHEARVLVRLAARLRRDGRLRGARPLPRGARRRERAGRVPSRRLRAHRLLDGRHQAGRHVGRQVQR